MGEHSTEHDIDIQHVDGDGIALYLKYPGQTAPQDCFVELDCEERSLTAESNPEIGNAVPERVWHGRILRWKIPCLTDDAANDLLDELAEDAAAVCDGYVCEWDGNNHVGRLDDNAKSAAERIREAIDRDWTERDTINMWDAADWYAPVDEHIAADLGITAETTDGRVCEIAEEEEEKAAADGHTVDGIEEYLLALRNKLRDEVRFGDAPKTYVLRDDGSEETIQAVSMEAACDAAREWVEGGDWDTSEGTIWIDVRVIEGAWAGENPAEESVTVQLDPEEPECDGEHEHEWKSPLHLVGGIKENPGVWGHGGGVITTEVCPYCGTKRVTDTWAQRSDTGEQGLESVSYEEAAFGLNSYAVVDERGKVLCTWQDAREHGDGLESRGNKLTTKHNGAKWQAVSDSIDVGDYVDEDGRCRDPRTNLDLSPHGCVGDEGEAWWECEECGDYAWVPPGQDPPDCSCGNGMVREESEPETPSDPDKPSYGEIAGLEPGVYSAENLNPPHGADCTHILVRADGRVSWCDADGDPGSWEPMTVEEFEE